MAVEVFEVTVEKLTTDVSVNGSIAMMIEADGTLTEVVEVVSSVNMTTELDSEWVLEEL